VSTTTTTTDWRALAVELADVAAELVTVSRAVSSGWRVDPLVCGMLNNNALAVGELVERVNAAAGEGGE
jgi:hypothetical protein